MANDQHDDDNGAHLADNRSQIVLRSLLYAASGAVPVPFLDDALRGGLRRGLFRHVAQQRKVDIDESALDVLCTDGPGATSEGRGVSSGIIATIGSALSLLRGRRWMRRMLVGVMVLRQLGEAQRLFQQATLFDHYCARHHLGPGIDANTARVLRQHFEEAGRAAGRELLTEAMDRSLLLAGRAAEVLPQRISALVRRGKRPPEEAAEVAPEPAEPVETRTILEVVQGGTRRLLRDAGLHRYSRRLVAVFDRLWHRGEAGAHPR